MRLKYCLAVVVAICAATTSAAFAQSGDAELDAWLQTAGLGPYAPETEDWDAIYEAAQGEPGLSVYMTSSRVGEAVEAFQALYPGVAVEAVHVPAPEMLLRLDRERQAGIHAAGIIHTDDPEQYLQHFGAELINYVPPEMKDLFAEHHREPVVIYRFLPTGWTYNPEVFPEGPPLGSIWDLTTEEFRGRVVIPDPLTTGSSLSYLVTVVGRADELAAEYERRFGEPLELRERDAGFEWLRRLLENDLTAVPGTRDAAEAVTNATDLRVALNNYGRMREVPDRYMFAFVHGLQPVDLVNLPAHLSILAYTPSPNTAKLVARYLLTLEGGAPWFAEGNPSPRIDWQPPAAWIEPLLDLTAWDVDYDFLMRTTDEVVDYWILHH
jgi:iron(III) transport system substrate-binding protein